MTVATDFDSPLFSMWRAMLRIRNVEESIADHYDNYEMRCPVHLSIGQEAVAVGVCEALEKDDIVYSNHRSHAHFLAKGGDMQGLIAELYGRQSGCCEGRGGSMHLIDRKAGFWGSTPIVAGTVPLAVGAAWASKLQGLSRLVVIFLGEGCFEEGAVHESMNFASLHQLPVLFVCENNGYSVYSNLEVRQPERSIYKVAGAHGIMSDIGDGNDVMAVRKLADNAVKAIRAGEGPYFLELQTFRWREHCGPLFDDHLDYRPEGELASWQSRCPVIKASDMLLAAADESVAKKMSRVEEQIREEITLAFSEALKAPLAIQSEYREYV